MVIGESICRAFGCEAKIEAVDVLGLLCKPKASFVRLELEVNTADVLR